MNAAQVIEIQRRVMGLVREARSGLAELEERVNTIWSNTARLTEEARRDDVALEIAEGRSGIAVSLEAARGALERGYSGVEDVLGRVRAVDPEDLQMRAMILVPILGAVPGDPARLINLYRQRHLLPADRRLIEEAAAAEIDARGNTDNYVFRDEWARVEQEFTANRGPEELEVLTHRETLDGISTYLGNAERIIGIDLALMDPTFEGDRDVLLLARPRPEAEVNRYETLNAGVMEGAV